VRCHAAATVVIAAVADVLGLGGIPAQAVETEKILFVALPSAIVVMALSKSVRR
jgi:uncharacterized membrane protein YtjA (UPF0391 family)